MDKGYTAQQFVGLFTPGLADQQAEDLFAREFGSLRGLSRGGQRCVSRYKGKFRIVITLFVHCTWSEMEAVIDYECLLGAHGEDVIKEVAVVSEDALETYRFFPPYTMNDHISKHNGLSWMDGNISYSLIHQTLTEATANFAHVYAKGDDKCTYLSGLLGRAVLNLDTFGCPERSEFRMETGCSMPCHRYPDKSCATRNAQSLYKWLIHHLQAKEYVKCPKDGSRHTAVFNSGVNQ
jgi:hypothetical protein